MITSTTTTIDGSTVSKQSFEYDAYTNRTKVYEYDFGTGAPGALLRARETDYVTIANGQDYAVSPSIHLRRLPKEERVFDGSGALKAKTIYEYDQYDPLRPALVDRGPANPTGVDTGEPLFNRNASWPYRGNLTTIRRWLDNPSGELLTTREYDNLGNMVRETDPRGKATTHTFSERFGSPDGDAQSNTPPSHLAGKRTYAFRSALTNPKLHVSYTQYDYFTGKPVDLEDINGVVASAFYEDTPNTLDRLTKVIRANSTAHGALKNQTVYTYDDVQRVVTTQRDKDLFGDAAHRTETAYDGLGREIQTLSYEPGDYIVVQKTYDAMGRLHRVSNPYRPASESASWTETRYDALGRPTAVITPDLATTTTAYSGNLTTVTDPAGKARQSRTDAAGRVTQLVEDAASLNYITTYTHDVFDNVISVTQGGQVRTFTYDSLSRLKTANNPESGLVSYTYDANGNVLTKSDARPVTATSTYDDLNRLATRSYSNGTPTVTYTYDDTTGGSFAKGRLTSVSSSVSGTPVSTTKLDTYDALGRVTSSQQTTNGVTYTMGYTYDLADRLLTERYPSGRVVSMSYDIAGRTTSVSEPGRTHASNFKYAPQGAMTDMKLGNGLWESVDFNGRLQPKWMRLGTVENGAQLFLLENGYGSTNNNGNVQVQVATLPGTPAVTLTTSYTYDGVNRLKTAGETSTAGASWSQTYAYDRWGNRAVTAGAVDPVHTPDATSDFSATNNRLTVTGVQYDAAGNLTQDAAGRPFTYDAENRQTSGAGSSYEYDGEGRRVKKVVSGSSTIFVHDAFGRLVAEYATGALPGTRYTTPDHLGSTRVLTGPTGTVLARSDFYPFGEQVASTLGGRNNIVGYGTPDESVRQKFTGKERDIETGLDFFEARYASGAQGRFTSPDPLLEQGRTVVQPQEWNRYTYVTNNPLRLVDPDGRQSYEFANSRDYLDELKAQAEALTSGRITRAQYDASIASQAKAYAVVGALLGGAYAVAEYGPAAVSAAVGFWARPQTQQTVTAAAEGLSGAPPGALGPLPSLAGTTGREFFRDALGYVKAASGGGLEKAHLFERFAAQIAERTGGAWNSVRINTKEGLSVFIGQRGEALVIDRAGRLFRGQLGTSIKAKKDGVDVLVDQLRPI